MKVINIKNQEPSEWRVWYNEWLEGFSEEFKGSVLDVGKSQYWDYSNLFEKYFTIDNDEKLDPTITCDISADKLMIEGTYNLILCNGMYEQLEGEPEIMIKNVYNLLKKGGTAIFGFVGQGYPAYGSRDLGRRIKDIKEAKELLKDFEIQSTKSFDDKYHYLIVKKI